MKLFFIIPCIILVICSLGIWYLLKRINHRIHKYDILPQSYESDIDAFIERTLMRGGRTMERLIHTSILATVALYRHSVSYVKNNKTITKIIHTIVRS